MKPARHFASSYAEARAKFLDAARSAGFALESHANPAKGPAGEALATDVAILGDATAPHVLIATSATHGVEGFCGSGAMVGLMADGVASGRATDTAIVLVHALNPHGFAHLRRTNEDNVDLNRNFVDHARHPANEAYAGLHPLLVPAEWEGPARAEADAALARFIEANGHPRYQDAVSRGQYTHQDGLFFGGFRPTWSNAVWRRILKRHGRARARIAVVDFHTGLGPRGYGEIQFERGPGDPEYARAQSWFGGEVTSPDDGSSSSASLTGYMAMAVADECATAERTCVAVEYGTLPIDTVLGAVRADNWLYARGDVASRLGRRIKRDIRDAFYGDDDAWKGAVFARAVEVARNALRGLAG